MLKMSPKNHEKSQTHSIPKFKSLNQLNAQTRAQAFKEKDKKRFLLLAETFQALGDSSRVQIVWALSKGELSVSELVELMDMSQPAISHHLRTLRNLHLVKIRKEGKGIYYSLDDGHLDILLKEGINHVEELL